MRKYIIFLITAVLVIVFVSSSAIAVSYQYKFKYGSWRRAWTSTVRVVERNINGKKYVKGYSASSSKYYNPYKRRWMIWPIEMISTQVKLVSPYGGETNYYYSVKYQNYYAERYTIPIHANTGNWIAYSYHRYKIGGKYYTKRLFEIKYVVQNY